VTRDDVLRTAAEVISAALNGDSAGHKGRSAVQEAVDLPLECWPDNETRQIAAAMASLHARGAIVDTATVYDELRRVNSPVEASLLVGMADIGMNTYIGDVHARTEALRDAFVRSEIAKRAQRLADTVFEIPADELESVLADFIGASDIPGPARRLAPSDVLNAPDPPRPVFQGGAVRGTLALLVAESGRSKSFLAMALSASIASGADLIAPFTPNETGRVLYVSFEDPASIVRLRLSRIREAAGIEPEILDTALSSGQLVFYCDVEGPFFEADKYGRVAHTRLFSELEAILRQARPVLLVIDPLSAAAAIADENSNAQVGVVAAELATLARKLDIVLLLVHHTGKAAAGAPGSQHAARGASALACRSRWIMQLSPRGTEQDDQPLLEARIVKDSYHVPHQPVVLERCQGGALRTVESRKPSNEAICEATLAWLLANPDSPVSAGAIRNRLGAGADAYREIVRQIPAATAPTIFKAIRWAIQHGILAEETYRDKARIRKKRLMPPHTSLSSQAMLSLDEECCSGVSP
jgi:hypothetical protein